MNQQARLGKATTLRYRPQEGRPSAATVTIKTKDLLDLTTAVEDETATIDSVNTTVDAASGVSQADPTILYLTATTSIVKEGIYILTDGEGRTEEVEVVGISSGDYVILKDALARDYESGDTFQGTELTYSLTAGNAQNRDGYPDVDFRCEWTYTVDGQEYVRETLYDVSRHPWYRAASVAGFKRWNSDLFSLFDIDSGADWESDLDEAFDRVIEHVDAQGYRPNALIQMDRLAIPTYWEVTFAKALAGVYPRYASQDPESYLERVEAQRALAYDTALKTITWLDKDQDNTKDTDETGAALRVVRMVS